MIANDVTQRLTFNGGDVHEREPGRVICYTDLEAFSVLSESFLEPGLSARRPTSRR